MAPLAVASMRALLVLGIRDWNMPLAAECNIGEGW